MAIVAAAVVPHSPLLIPTIAKHHAASLKETVAAVEQIVNDCYAAEPDVIVVLTPHGESHPNSLVVHTAEQFQGNFAAFGDIDTKVTAPGTLGYTHRLKSAAEHHHLPLFLRTFEELDYGVSVPLFYLQQGLAKTPIVPISLPHHEHDILLRTGALLNAFCGSERERVALIASADFSRRDQNASNAKRPTAEEKKLSTAMTEVDPTIATALEPQSSTCAYGPVVALLAALQHLNATGKITSFAAPLGVGLLTTSFSFPA